MRGALAALLLALQATAGAAQQDMRGKIDSALTLVENAVQQSFARALPFPAPSAGVSYSFDATTGNFQRDPSTFGQVYLERADPLGAGRLNLSLMYQYVNLDELDGHDVSDLRTPHPIPLPDVLAAAALPTLNFSANVQQVLFSTSYGITHDLEASLAVPIVYSHVAVDAPVNGAAITPGGELVLINARVTTAANHVGAGDVFLRAKYRVAELSQVHLSAAMLLRLPSGNVDDLQGIGYVELTPSVIASTRLYEPAPWARLQGHFNGAVALDTEEVGNSEARWGFGFDWGVTESLTAGIAFLAQNQFERVAPPGTFTVPQCQSDLVTCAADPSVRVGTQQLYGLSGGRPDYYDVSIGGRGALWKDTIFAFANVAIPLNDGFVRFDPIPLVGLEATF
jgi:hypothetical protein